MRRIFALFTTFALILSLVSCGKTEKNAPVEYGSAAEAGAALGYQLPEPDLEANGLTFASAEVLQDEVAHVTYNASGSVVDFFVTTEKSRFKGLAGLNGSSAGGVEAPSEEFSPLAIQVADSSTLYSEFSYTYDEHDCYLALAETFSASKSDYLDLLNRYSELLISYADQLHNLEEAPDFVRYLDEKATGKDKEDSSASASASGSDAPAEESAQPDQSEAPAEEPAKPAESETPAEEPAKPAESESPTEKPEKPAESEAPTEKPEKPAESEAPAEKPEKPAKTEAPAESASALELDYYDLTLIHIGDAYTLKVTGGNGSYEWHSADSSIASVSEGGTVKAVGSGKTTVTCTSGNSTASAVIRVR